MSSRSTATGSSLPRHHSALHSYCGRGDIGRKGRWRVVGVRTTSEQREQTAQQRTECHPAENRSSDALRSVRRTRAALCRTGRTRRECARVGVQRFQVRVKPASELLGAGRVLRDRFLKDYRRLSTASVAPDCVPPTRVSSCSAFAVSELFRSAIVVFRSQFLVQNQKSFSCAGRVITNIRPAAHFPHDELVKNREAFTRDGGLRAAIRDRTPTHPHRASTRFALR